MHVTEIKPAPLVRFRSIHADVDQRSQIAVLGDFYLGDWYMRWREKRGRSNVLVEKGVDHCFKHFEEFLKSSSFAIANLEATLTRTTQSPFSGKKDYILDASPELTLDALRRYRIGGVTLGNNHAGDFGANGIGLSLHFLQSAGILACGAGDSSSSAAEPLIIEIAAEEFRRELVVFSAYAYNDEYGQNFSYFASAHTGGVCALDSHFLTCMNKWRAKCPNALILCCPHWGSNYRWRSSRQVELADQILAAGADLIIGHGAHMMQEIERRAGRWVIYSLGNFVFNNHGEYARYGVPAFSLACKIVLYLVGSKLAAKILLYPFYCDNVRTNWQPRWVDEVQFGQITYQLMTQLGPDEAITIGEDVYAPYIELEIDGESGVTAQ